MSAFNPQALLKAAVTGKTSTKMVAAPAGDYVGVLTKVDVGAQVIKNGERAGETFYKAVYTVDVDGDPKLDAAGLSPKRKFRIECLLDITPNGGLDMGLGKNVALGRLREAVDQNWDNQEWDMGMPIGRPVKFTVFHEPDPKDAENIFERIKGVRSPSVD